MQASTGLMSRQLRAAPPAAARSGGSGGSCVASAGRVAPRAAVVVARRSSAPRRLVVVASSTTKKQQEQQQPVTPATAPAHGGSGASPQQQQQQQQQQQEQRVELAWPAKRGWLEVALSKVVDTAEDVGVIARRTFGAQLPAAVDRLFRRGASGRLTLRRTKKPVVLVLGTGWGAHSLVKVIDTEAFDVVIVSPRNHFVFTPLLPSTAVGTVEFRSLLEPIRISNPQAAYVQAACDRLDTANKVAYCTAAAAYEDGTCPSFEIPYDIAVVAVGEQPSTFGVPGVADHCHFMKEVSDTVALRNKIMQSFELAALPGTSEAERRKALHFVVVGGGPTGVEFAGTLNDFVRVDLARKYPELMPFVRVTLLQSADSILTQFSGTLQERAIANFKATGVDVRLRVRVTGVNRDVIEVQGKAEQGGSASTERLEYGVCVWSAGNAARPLVRDLVKALPSQAAYNTLERPATAKLAVDPYLRVVGVRDVIALGDCALLTGDRLPATAQVAGQQGAYVARMVNRGYTPGVGGLDQAPPLRVPAGATAPAEEGGAGLRSVDVEALRQLRPVDAAAIASQPRLTETDIAAVLGNDSTYLPGAAPPGFLYYRKPFEFLSLGLLAYIGNDKALTQVEVLDALQINLSGELAFLLWRSVYLTKQVSFRNRVLILFDWMKSRVFGRDLSQF